MQIHITSVTYEFCSFSVTGGTTNCTMRLAALQTTIWAGCGVLATKSFGFLMTHN